MDLPNHQAGCDFCPHTSMDTGRVIYTCDRCAADCCSDCCDDDEGYAPLLCARCLTRPEAG
jgi:hypothetical protein